MSYYIGDRRYLLTSLDIICDEIERLVLAVPPVVYGENGREARR